MKYLLNAGANLKCEKCNILRNHNLNLMEADNGMVVASCECYTCNHTENKTLSSHNTILTLLRK